ncbi:unnamed protein product, partial [Onchocerca ochengi]|uniref:Uncharacterized protein n=1 Tax=Onchocerca ochengi TaxID=42157 RepID=A0A182F0K7_ONCOC
MKRTISSCMACKRWKAKPFKLPLVPNRITSTAIESIRAC